MKIGIHIFRKDLRVFDNFALNELAKQVDSIVGVFVLDPKLIKSSSTNKSHYSEKAAQFVVDSVKDLQSQCNNKLVIVNGNPVKELEKLIDVIHPEAVSFNADFTPYSINRDQALIKMCEQYQIKCICNEDDQSLTNMKSMIKQNGKPYMVYGPFYKLISKKLIPRPRTEKMRWHKPQGIDNVNLPNIAQSIWMGGRGEGKRRLKARALTVASMKLSDTTTQLSAYLNQGCLSIREVYWAFKQRSTSIEPLRAIAWRDFFLCIYRFHPDANNYERHIDHRYDQIKWPKINEEEWNAFMKCDTGFLLVDAAMKELKETGYINNRSRLILGTFWIKYLRIHPMDKVYGAQSWFSRLLVDCSASQNKLNYQWIIGDLDISGRRFSMKGEHPLTGRMIRIDNEMIKKYDSSYAYIKQWIPAYKDLSVKDCKQMMKNTSTIFDWEKRYQSYANLFDKIKK